MNEQAISFNCQGKEIHGIYHDASDATIGLIIVVGGPQTRHGSHRSFVELARFLAQNGVAVLRFDYRGAGDSDGDIQTFEQTPKDIAAAVAFFKASNPKIKALNLWGLCDAASAIAMYLHNYDEGVISNVVLLNPWVQSSQLKAKAYIKHYYLKKLMSLAFWKKLLSGRVKLRQSVGDISAFQRESNQESNLGFVESMRLGLNNFSGATHIILSEHDLTAKQFMLLINEDKSWNRLNFKGLTEIKGANHTFACPQWKQQIFALTLNAIISS